MNNSQLINGRYVDPKDHVDYQQPPPLAQVLLGYFIMCAIATGVGFAGVYLFRIILYVLGG